MLVALAFAAVVAEPEADANADAGYYGYYGLGYYGYPYRYGYYGHPYRWGHYLGKREAEAEPTAAAEPEAGIYGYPGYYRYGSYRGFPYARYVNMFFIRLYT